MTKKIQHLDQQVCFALYAASRAMISAYQPLLVDLGVTYPQYLVLLVLWEERTARVSRLGERLQLDSGTLTPLLKRLEAAGLVERRRRVDDERVVDVHLTSAGKDLEKRAAKIPEAIFCKSGLSLKEGLLLQETLRKVVRSLEERDE